MARHDEQPGSGASDEPGKPPEKSGAGEDDATGSGTEELRLAGAELLRGGPPRQVIRRLFEGDPLGIEVRCASSMERRLVLFDMNELFTDVLARVAFDASDYVAGEPVDPWLGARIDLCINEALLKDREDERDHRPVGPPFQTRYLLFAALFGIDPGFGRQACIVFNSAPDEERRVFWETHILKKSLKRYVAQGHGPPRQAREHLRSILRKLARVGSDDWQGPELRGWRQ